VQRPKDRSEALTTSTCTRVLDLIKKVAVVKLRVKNGSGDGGSCFGIEIWMETAKMTNMVIARFGDR